MRQLLCVTVLVLLGTEVFNWDLTLMTGLSVKNGILYLLISFLLLRMVVTRTGAFEARPMQVAWGVLIGYALLTWIIAGVLIGYARYDLIESGIRFKSGLVDYYIFFLVFFLGTRSLDDTSAVTRTLLFGAVFANLATILDTSGVVDFGYVEREDGRTQGALGESNQYAAFIILVLPAIIASAVSAHGVRRLFWFAGTLVSIVALMLTASRGAMVGALVAAVVGAYLYRRHWSVGKMAVWLVGGLALLAILLTVSQSYELLAERVLNQTGSIDMSDASSGRSEIWAEAIATMFRTPVTLITGFGWDVYWSMPFRFSPHNHYLGLWFNLGLFGLLAGTFVLYYAIRRAKRASDVARAPYRGLLVGFVIGTIAMCVAIFFVDLHQPWAYFWLYAGVTLRTALLVEQERKVQEKQRERVPDKRPAVPGLQAGNLGWTKAGPRTVTDTHGWAVRTRTTRATR